MAGDSGSEQYARINAGRASRASSRGGSMKDVASRNNGSNTPF